MKITGLTIKNIALENNLILAPMAGYTDVAMRKLCREAGAGLTVTEMVSAKGLMYGNKNTETLLITTDCETPSCVQLFGNDPAVFREVIKNNAALSNFGIIDINMGCPVRKIVSCGEGSALVNDIKKAAAIIEAAASSTTRPITVKFRLPAEGGGKQAAVFIKAVAEAGAAMVALHGRTAKQMYGGSADWDAILCAAKDAAIPLIGNGDICCAADARKRLATQPDQSDGLRQNGNNNSNNKRLDGDYSRPSDSPACINNGSPSVISGIMIGRGAIGRPWLFTDILQEANRTNAGGEFAERGSEFIKAQMTKHVLYMNEYYGERYTVANMRKHLCFYVRGMRDMREFRNKINCSSSVAEILELISEI